MLFSNPELIRNLRIQLRPGRMVATATICAVGSLVVSYSMARGYVAHSHWAAQFLAIVLYAQLFALAIGGGIICLHAIQREKDMQTFDFQRVTRLTPLDLAFGKLFGAPAMAYFVALCLMPAALVAAALAGAQPSFVLAAYVVLLMGSIALHAAALVLSLLATRGAASAAVLLWLVAVGLTSFNSTGSTGLYLGRLSPFFAIDLVGERTWHVSDEIQWHLAAPDIFFGRPVHHFYVLIFLYATFTGWLLLALHRNIKRDPATYELFNPAQSLGLALYLNLVVLGFFRWKQFTPLDSQAWLTALNTGVFFLLGLVLLRNRDRLRRRLRQLGAPAAGWFAAAWPASHLLLGTVLVGVAILGMIQKNHVSSKPWEPALAAFRQAFFALWLVRDVLYLQWMNLRRGRRSLAMGFLYLLVFYACANILFAALGFYEKAGRVPYTAVLVPSPVFLLDGALWASQPWMWVVALVTQGAVAGMFVFLQRQKLRELASLPPAD